MSAETWQWPDPAEDGPACTCPAPGVVFYLGRHDEDCPAAAVKSPRPTRRPPDQGWQ